jgi:hypothetical protein
MSQRRRRTIGDNPLDAVIPQTTTARGRDSLTPPLRAVTVGVAFDPELLERARNAVYWTPGMTLTGLANLGLSQAVDDLEQRNGGQPFPARAGTMRTGRPIRELAASPQGNGQTSGA